ncbi:MAG: sialidase family protein, partial [Candidatus Sericytochromatia bacterium]
MQTSRLAPVTLLLLGALAFAGCDEVVPNLPQTPDGGAVQDGDGRPLTFPQLSSQKEAQFASMVVGADGTLHAIYQDKNQQHFRPQVYHRASTDGGATWSEEINLLEDDPTSQAGFVRAAVDGQGRVYAFWKTYKGFDIVEASGGSVGTVAYRALVNGQWSPITTVGTIDQVMGWFADTAPDGTLHLVWSETMPREGGGFTPDWQAGRIKQATLSGATVGEARVVFEAPPQRVGESPVVNYDGYRGLEGYVDAAGTAHFVALKTVTTAEVGAPSDLVDVVHFDGANETPVLKVAGLEAVGAAPIRWSPPML